MAISSKEFHSNTTAWSQSTASPTVASFAHVNPPPPASTSSESFSRDESAIECTSGSNSFLLEKLVGDVVVAVSVTALAAPFLTVIDKALVERSATASTSVLSSMYGSVSSMLRNPVAFCRSPTYLWMWGTYAATYSAANTLRTLTEVSSQTKRSNNNHNRTTPTTQLDTPPVSQTASTTLFVGTALVNSSMSILKDRAYARMYGNAATTFSIPKISYGLWMVRDLTVIGAAFVLPTYVASVLKQHMNGWSQADATRVAQLVTPVAVQVIAGPLHFVGYDYYNRPVVRHGLMERLSFLRVGFVEVVSARMCRILPGYGIAGVLNTEWRSAWRKQVALSSYHRTPALVPSTSSSSPNLLQSASNGLLR